MNAESSFVKADSEVRYIGEVLDTLEIIDEDVMTRMRTAYPHLRFTLCSEDDTGDREPYAVFGQFDMHLVAGGRTSCASLTQDVTISNGLVIALHEE